MNCLPFNQSKGRRKVLEKEETKIQIHFCESNANHSLLLGAPFFPLALLLTCVCLRESAKSNVTRDWQKRISDIFFSSDLPRLTVKKWQKLSDCYVITPKKERKFMVKKKTFKDRGGGDMMFL